MSESLADFLVKARTNGVIRFELKSDERNTLRCWDLPPLEAGEIDAESVAMEIRALAEEDSDGLRQAARYRVVALSPSGIQWGTKTISTMPAHLVAKSDQLAQPFNAHPFTEADASVQGLVVELIRTSREEKRANQVANHQVQARMMELVDTLGMMLKGVMEDFTKVLTLQRELSDDKETRELRMMEFASKQKAMSEVVGVVKAAVPVMASRVAAHATGNRAAMLPEALQAIADEIFADDVKGQASGQAILNAMPDEKKPLALEFMSILHADWEQRQAMKEAEKAKEMNGAPS
jgi:hypothetical protein